MSQTVYARMVQGQTGVSATIRSGTPTALVATAASVTEQAGADPDPGLYAIVFSTLVAAGTYTLKLVKSGTVYATRTVTLTGVDGETAVAVGEAAALDPAVETQIDNIENASGYLLAVLAGACADPQTASETYAITVFGSTFTVDMAGQTSTGTRTAPTLTKS